MLMRREMMTMMIWVVKDPEVGSQTIVSKHQESVCQGQRIFWQELKEFQGIFPADCPPWMGPRVRNRTSGREGRQFAGDDEDEVPTIRGSTTRSQT